MNHHHVCPWYMGYLLASPLRRLTQNPEKILSGYVEKGINILEIGPGMGFFTLPLAKMTGNTGRVYAPELQEKMLSSLIKKIKKARLGRIVETIKCTENSLAIGHLKGKIDFALAFAVVHEVPDKKGLFTQIFDSMKKGGKLLIAEPEKRVTVEELLKSTESAISAGFEKNGVPEIPGSRSVLLIKN